MPCAHEFAGEPPSPAWSLFKAAEHASEASFWRSHSSNQKHKEATTHKARVPGKADYYAVDVRSCIAEENLLMRSETTRPLQCALWAQTCPRKRGE